MGIQAYVKTKADWEKFVNGETIVVSRNHYQGYYKKINVAEIEIVILERNEAYIKKEYW